MGSIEESETMFAPAMLAAAEQPYILPHLPVVLPAAPLPATDEPASLIDTQQWLHNLTSLQASHFDQHAVWRDLFSLTGTARTFYSGSTIASTWAKRTRALQAHDFKLSIPRFSPSKTWIDVPFTFATTGPPATTCSGTLCLVPDSQSRGWRIWLLKTCLEDLKSSPGVDAAPRFTGAELAPIKNADGSFEVECVVMGAGQAGLAAGGRLQALGVKYVVLEKNPTVGDGWRRRYDSAKLHTIREYAHLPFERTFAKDVDGENTEWLRKNVLADGFEGWVQRFGANVWTNCKDLKGRYNKEDKKWRLTVLKDDKLIDIVCRYFIFAGGFGGQIPKEPRLYGKEKFRGEVMHSEQYQNAKAWAGKHGVVVGSANTAHDVVEDMLQAGCASVTMIQRSPTVLVQTDHYATMVRRVYNEDIPTEVSDRVQFDGPFAVGRLIVGGGLNNMRKTLTPAYVRDVEKQGFKVNQNEDVVFSLYVRSGRHYSDIGGIDRISKGDVKVRSGAEAVGFTENGLVLSNGEVLPADVVVLATGFELEMKNTVSSTFGSEVADQIKPLWGFDEEGELRGAFVPSGHEAFWYCGGALGQTRFYSRFVAMQIKAKLDGTPLQIYDERQPAIQYI